MKERIESNNKLKLLVVLITIILIVLMFPQGESLDSEITIGTVWLKDDLIANENFPIYKDPVQYQKERMEAANSVFPIFTLDKGVHQKMLDSLKSGSKKLVALIDSSLKYSYINVEPKFISPSSFEVLKKLRRQDLKISIHNNVSLKYSFGFVEELLNKLYQKGILDRIYSDIPKDSIALKDGKFEKLYPKRKYFDRNSAVSYVNKLIRDNLKGSDELKVAVSEVIDNFIQPNLIFQKDLTELAKKTAMDLVSPNEGIFKKDERIIGKHERVTAKTKKIIESYRRLKGEEKSIISVVFQWVGKFIHIIILLLILSIYIFLFRKHIYNNIFKILLISINILFVTFIAFIVQKLSVNLPLEYMILVPVASMLLTIMFDSRIGFYGTIVVSLICGALRGNDYVFAVTHIVAGALAAYTVRDIKNRNQIFRSFGYISLGYVLSILAFGFERFLSYSEMLQQASFAVINALVSPILTFGLIIFFEKAFKITTDLTFLELSDFNHPALKELSRKAPGTFTHSMTIGTMVETAAEEIGANPTLARVGAYYHDIGKSEEPDFFVENQLNNENIHEKLSPEQSAKLIVNHVVRGIEIAKSYNLPQEIIDFIPMHHGTMTIKYFYEKAKELYGEDKVDINDFRYPGPLPNNKETALVMLADACESTVRSMEEPDPVKIENVINNLINLRIDEGQLDESPITFKDIKVIKETFLNILISQHHKRIRYPNQEEMENTSEEKDQ